MAALGQCDCGYVVRGDTRLTVLESLKMHIETRHQSTHLSLVPDASEKARVAGLPRG